MQFSNLPKHKAYEVAPYEENIEFIDVRVKDIQGMNQKIRESAYVRQVDLDNATVGALEALEDNQNLLDREIWNLREQQKMIKQWCGYQDDELEAIQLFFDSQRNPDPAPMTVSSRNDKRRATLQTFPQARPSLVPGYIKDITNVYTKETNMDFNGQGVFANKDIQQDHFICSYRGDTEEHRESVSIKDCIGDSTFYDPYNHYYVIGNKVDSYGPNVNDTGNPSDVNCQIRFSPELGYAAVFATKHIKKDQEILTSYGTDYWNMASNSRTSKKKVPTITSSTDNKKRKRQL
jgi:hypothetical protein